MTQTKLDILAFAPHPDDAEIFCGGLLLKMSEAGHAIGIIDMTRGELASGGNVETRNEETCAATSILGLQLRENLELPDGNIQGEGGENDEQLKRVVASIRRHQPSIVLAPYQQARHPDHSATSALVRRAVFFSGVRKFNVATEDPHFTPTQLLYYQMRFSFRPSFIVNTTAQWDKKLQAIEAYNSQVAQQAKSGEPAPLIGSALSLKSIEARDRYYGAMIGCEFGEPFFAENALNIADPVAYFRENPNNGALIFPETS